VAVELAVDHLRTLARLGGPGLEGALTPRDPSAPSYRGLSVGEVLW
jgi:hypothetical protein